MVSKQFERATALRAQGLCSSCAKPRGETGTTWLCRKCADKNLKANKRWHQKNRPPKRHVLSVECWCLPHLEIRDGVKVWVHEGGQWHGG